MNNSKNQFNSSFNINELKYLKIIQNKKRNSTIYLIGSNHLSIYSAENIKKVNKIKIVII